MKSARLRLSIVATATLLLLPIGCRREKPRKPAAESAAVRRFPLKGVIEEVNLTSSEVTVRHEAVPGYMAGMTMPFPVKDEPQVVGILRPGDRIEATLVVDGERYWLEKILTKGFVPTAISGAPAALASVTPQPNRAIGVGQRVPDFALTDQTGATVRLSQMRGEPVAVTFLYTQCPVATACPMTTAKFSRLDAMLKEKNFGRLLVVTVDPEHDTPKVLAEYAKKAGADPERWKFLTGSPRSVADVATSFGVMYYADRAQVVHSQAVAVVDPEGRLSTIYYGDTWQPEHVLRDLEKARSDSEKARKG